jgi:hypothetical protein
MRRVWPHALLEATTAFIASAASVLESERTRQRLQVNLGKLAQQHQHLLARKAATQGSNRRDTTEQQLRKQSH